MDVPIYLDKARGLRFTLRSLRELEDAMGKPVGAISNDLRMLGVNAILACLVAGLKHEDKSLTRNLVEKILEDYLDQPSSPGMRPVLKALDDALSGSGLLKHAGEDEPEGNARPEPQATT